ncbi:hypothetical protein [Dactylosporangium sp. NPDC051541]|uniref:hypothetical protein n=1 Tax=Dactylosporangium sp. NPDC051541 TaxID=3363977 RepID=UPI0037A1E6F1
MSADGNWHLEIDSPTGKTNVALSLTQDGDQLGGTLTNLSNNLSTELYDGRADGEQLRWKAKLQQLKATLTFDVAVTGDSMSGKVKAGVFGRFNVVGTRVAQN